MFASLWPERKKPRAKKEPDLRLGIRPHPVKTMRPVQRKVHLCDVDSVFLPESEVFNEFLHKSDVSNINRFNNLSGSRGICSDSGQYFCYLSNRVRNVEEMREGQQHGRFYNDAWFRGAGFVSRRIYSHWRFAPPQDLARSGPCIGNPGPCH